MEWCRRALVSRERARNAVLVASSAGRGGLRSRGRPRPALLIEGYPQLGSGRGERGEGVGLLLHTCCHVLLLSLDQLAQDEVGGFIGGEFAACHGLGHRCDALRVFVAGASGIAATKGMLVGVDG